MAVLLTFSRIYKRNANLDLCCGEIMQKITKLFRNTLTTATLILTLSAINAMAATFTVTNTNDSGAGSLRQAVLDANAAATADTIVFDASFNTPRTITLATEIRISPNGQTADTLTIIGPGTNLLTINGNNVTLIFLTIPGDTTSISGMTLTGGNALQSGGRGGAISNDGILTLTNVVFTQNAITSGGAGGAIYNSTNGSPTSGILNIVGCVFTNNVSNSGGAIFSNNGNVTITDTIVTGNTARNGGGGINNYGVANITNSTISNNNSGFTGNSNGGGGIFNFGEMTLTNSTVSGNRAGEDTQGGGIRNVAKLTLINSSVTGNTATEGGGGIYASGPGTVFLTITNSTVSNNFANTGTGSTTFGNGGGIWTTMPTTVTGSTISGNSVRLIDPIQGDRQGNGGGIFTQDRLTMENSTVSGNFAERNGGGIFAYFGGITMQTVVTSSTIANNTAGRNAGGVFRIDSPSVTFTIGNTIIANNSGGTSPDVNGNFISHGYNLIENTTGSFGFGAAGDQLSVNPLLGTLQNNGGATQTVALQAGSPALNAGSNALAVDQNGNPLAFDQRGAGFGRIIEGTVDIGAFEAQTTAATILIEGFVRTATGAPIVGAIVTLSGSAQETMLTDSEGHYRFTVPSGGVYQVSVTAPGFRFSPAQQTFGSTVVNQVGDFTGQRVQRRTLRNLRRTRIR